MAEGLHQAHHGQVGIGAQVQGAAERHQGFFDGAGEGQRGAEIVQQIR